MKGAGRARELLFGLSLFPILFGAWAVAVLRLDVERMALLQGVLGVASAAWLAAVLLARRVGDSRALLVGLVGGAVALRLFALAGAPELSDDVHRYVWEAGVVLEGKSPYAFGPEDPALAAERAAWPAVHGAVAHPEVSAAYPPLTQAANAIVVALAGGPDAAGGTRALLFLRLSFALADLLVLWPLLVLLRRTGRPRALAVVWAWSPLVAFEFAGAGHFDALGILLLVAAVAVVVVGAPTGRRAESGGRGLPAVRASLASLFLGLGALVKLLPAAAAPFVLRRARRPERQLGLFLAVVGGGWAAVALLLEGGPRGILRGLSEYAFRWESFNLLYRWIERPLGLVLERDEGWSDPRRVGRALVLVVWLGLLVRAWRRRTPLASAVLLGVGGFLALAPTLHPWYVAWIVPLLALRPHPAWLFLVAAAPLLYWPLPEWRASGTWEEPPWLWPAVALPFWLLLAGESWRVARARGRAAAEAT